MTDRQTSGFPLQNYYSSIYRSYDLVNRIITLGFDKKWRKQTIDACLEGSPKNILDLCCGTGDLAIGICQAAVSPVHITGFDLNAEMLAVARQKAQNCKTSAIEFVQGDVAFMPFKDGEFDCITVGFGFRNLVFENPARDRHIKEIARIMKPEARLLILESGRPDHKWLAFFYRMYLKLFMIPFGGMLSGNWRAYRYLALSSARFYGISALSDMLQKQHLELQLGKKFLFGSANLLFATKITK
jgi:demethylmenaquinone methyltransferase/2-methoxy-6-polyprenyl-1,4-benzoquinol methylase